MLTGWPGIGKTTLWEACLDEASAAGLRVLSARPSDAEARLVFGALIDVLDRVGSSDRTVGPRRAVPSWSVSAPGRRRMPVS